MYGWLVLTVFIFSNIILSEGQSAPYQPNWASLDTRPLPSWYQNAKFGIFIHWGLYSVPSWAPVGEYAEWYWHSQMDPNSATSLFHNQTYGPNFKYQDFASHFKAELFNATEWIQLFKASGAKYIVPTSKHHEGFTLWKSLSSWNWNSVEVGPHIDILNELVKAVRYNNNESGLKIGFYYSLYEWFNPIYLSNLNDYIQQLMIPQLKELVNLYTPDILWADGEWDHSSDQWQTADFIAWLYNESPVKDDIVVNDRWGNETRNLHGGFFTPEYDSTVHLDHSWEENSGIDVHSFGLNRLTPADKYWSSEYLINLLIRCVSNNGNFLLDIGPAADGTIPPIMQDRLLNIGAWLKVNGESIYNSKIYKIQYEGQGIDNTTVRYTMSNNNNGENEFIYAHVLSWPDNNLLSLSGPIVSSNTEVFLLGEEKLGPLKYTAGASGMTISLPQLNPQTTPTKYVWVLKISNAK